MIGPITTSFHKRSRLLATLLPASFAAVILLPIVATASTTRVASPAVAVKGLTTAWQLSLDHIRQLDQIPHVYWKANRTHFYQIYVLTLTLKNTGERPADPFDDLMLTLKVTQPKYAVNTASYTAGFTQPQRIDSFPAMYTEAAKLYGGTVPWSVTKPGATTVYTYIISTSRGNTHYGLYNFYYKPPTIGYVFLLNTGL